MSLVPYNATEVAQGSTDNSDESMNGQGRAPRGGPIVVGPDDRLGPTDEEPARRFYQWAPQFHWHLEVPSIVDEGARRAVEQIVGDAFRFGQQTEEHEHYLLSQVQGNGQRLQTTEDTMTTLRATLESVQHNLREAQSDYGRLEMQLALLELRLVADQSATPQQITNSENSQFDEYRQIVQQKLDQCKEELSEEFVDFKQDHQAQWQQIQEDNIQCCLHLRRMEDFGFVSITGC